MPSLHNGSRHVLIDIVWLVWKRLIRVHGLRWMRGHGCLCSPPRGASFSAGGSMMVAVAGAAQRATSNPASLTKADLLHTAQPPTGWLSSISHQNMTMLFWLLCIQSNTLSSDIIWYLFIFLPFSFLHDLNFHFSFRQKEQKMALMCGS